MQSSNELTAKAVKLSLLEKLEAAPHRVAAPIECDTVSFAPPEGLLVAGFPWKARASEGEEGSVEVDPDLADTVIAWSAQGNAAKTAMEKIECVIEIDYKSDAPLEDLIHLAASGECSLALTGLAMGADEVEEGLYCERLEAFAAAMLRAGNYTKSLYPFSPVFEALFMERLGKAEDAKAARLDWARRKVDIDQPAAARIEYALRRTGLGRLSVEKACERALLAHFGGEQMLDAALMALARPIAQRLESFANERLDKPKSKQDRYELGEPAAGASGQ